MKNKIHSKQISVLFGLFLIVLVCGCKNETGQLSREQAPDPYYLRGADIYLVSNDIALPFDMEYSGDKRMRNRRYLRFKIFDRYVRDKREQLKAQFLNQQVDSVRVYGISPSFQLNASYKHQWYKRGEIIPYTYYYLFRVNDNGASKGLDFRSSGHEEIEINTSEVEFIDVQNKKIRLKNGFEGKVGFPKMETDMLNLKKLLSKLLIHFNIYEQSSSFGQPTYKQSKRIEEIVTTLDVGKLEYLCFNYDGLDSLANFLGKKLTINHDFHFFLNLENVKSDSLENISMK